MAHLKRLVSSVLLVVGVLLVFLGLIGALGFTPTGVLAITAAIAALLYAGAIWSGALLSGQVSGIMLPILVFDRDRRVVSGAGAGKPLSLQFPEMLRAEIERRCAVALAGTSTRFPCLHNGKLMVVEAVPVRKTDGMVVYGILLSTELEPAAIVATA
jgi:hypothetical protein